MLKKCILITWLSLSVFSVAHADIFSKSKKDFNEKVMKIMQDIENNPITKENIDEYLNHINVSNDVKQAVKSNIEHHVNYSDFHKVSEGIYLCNNMSEQNKSDQFHAQCSYFGESRGYQCAYTPNNIMCHSIPTHPGPDKSTCKP